MQKVFTKRSAKGFSLVELLAVVLILAVLAAVAVPLYINTRKTSAARTCKANITAIASAESAWALRNGSYIYDSGSNLVVSTSYVGGSAPSGGLVGAPEGLATALYCPVDGTSVYTVTQTGSTGNCVIHCPKDSDHGAAMGEASPYASWNKTLSPKAAETIP